MLVRETIEQLVVTGQSGTQDHHLDIAAQQVIGHFREQVPTFLRIETANLRKERYLRPFRRESKDAPAPGYQAIARSAPPCLSRILGI